MEDNQKYQDILETAHHLFWKFGIRRVSVEEVCKEAGVSKMTFYRFFKNKIELARKVIDDIFEDAEEKYTALMNRDIPFEEKIKEQIIMKFEGTKDISEEIIKDIYSGWNKELHKIFMTYAARMTQRVQNDYIEAQKKGHIRKDVNINFIFYLSQKMAEMTTDPHLMAIYKTPQEAIMEFMNMLFYGILPRENE